MADGDNKIKYTPGPWKYEAYLTASENEKGYSVYAKTYEIAKVWQLDQDGIKGEVNAKLIAAAPELLEALKLLMERVGPALAGSQFADLQNLWDMASRAVVKAEREDINE